MSIARGNGRLPLLFLLKLEAFHFFLNPLNLGWNLHWITEESLETEKSLFPSVLKAKAVANFLWPFKVSIL